MRWYWSTAGMLVASTSLPLVALSWYAWRRRSLSAAGALGLALGAAGWWALAHSLALTSPTPSAAALWADAALVGALLAPPSWLVFALRYTGRAAWTTPTRTGGLAVVPLVAVALLVNGSTHDLVQTARAAGAGGLGGTRPGPVGLALAAYTAVLLAAGTALLVASFLRIGRVHRRESALLAVAAVVPAAGAGLRAAGVLGFDVVDPTPFLLLAAGKVLVWGVFRFGLLEFAPVARDAIIERMTDGVIVLDAQRRIVDVNPAAERLLDRGAALAIGTPATALLPRCGELLDRIDGTGDVHEEVRLGAPGSARDYDLVLSALADQRGAPSGHLLVLRDVTERKLAEERLQRLAHYDPLTGLPNRKLLHDRLDAALRRARRHDWPVAVLFCDLDRFKRVNDTLGHDVGDLVLQQVTKRFQEVLRPGDTLARLGGDEFVVVLPDVERATDAGIVARNLVESLAAPLTAGSQELYLTVSVGVCLRPRDGTDPATLLRAADDAMYRAKARGRNRVEFHRRPPGGTPFGRLEMERELRGARGRGELEVWYQPTIGLASGSLVGMEALLRWRHPERGVIEPDVFIPVAEETELIHALGQWTLRESCRQAVRWGANAGQGGPWMAVNLSARQFEHADLASEVADVLDDTGLDPGRLALEVTESVVMKDAASAVRILHDLKRLGVGIATDDFGTGFTSLGQLKHYPLDVLKIDRSFVKGLGQEQEDEVIVAAMIHLAHDLGLKVGAEGVEDAVQRDLLRSLRCDHAQGYLFSRPLPVPQADRFLQRARRLPAAS